MICKNNSFSFFFKFKAAGILFYTNWIFYLIPFQKSFLATVQIRIMCISLILFSLIRVARRKITGKSMHMTKMLRIIYNHFLSDNLKSHQFIWFKLRNIVSEFPYEKMNYNIRCWIDASILILSFSYMSKFIIIPIGLDDSNVHTKRKNTIWSLRISQPKIFVHVLFTSVQLY